MKYDPVKVPLDSVGVERNTRNECINEIRSRIPEALWDKTSEDLVRDQCLSLWTCCIECIKEMADAWEEQNGENLVWVPGHYEVQKEKDCKKGGNF